MVVVVNVLKHVKPLQELQNLKYSYYAGQLFHSDSIYITLKFNIQQHNVYKALYVIHT